MYVAKTEPRHNQSNTIGLRHLHRSNSVEAIPALRTTGSVPKYVFSRSNASISQHRSPNVSQHPPASKLGSKVSDNDKVWKTIWTTSVLICASVCIYQIRDRIAHYLSEPITSNVELIRNTSLQFPSFTICPPMPFRYTKLIRLFRERELTQKQSILHLLKLVNSSDFYELASYKMNKFAEKQTHSDRELMLYLSLTNMPALNSIIYPKLHNVSTFYGKCLTAYFDKPALYQGISTMFKIYFTVLMNVETQNTVRDFTMDIDKISTLYIHENYDDPVHIAPISSFKMLRGYRTIASLSVKEYKFLNRKKKKCISQMAANKCRGDCIAELVLPDAKCRFPMDFPQLDHLPVCNDFESFNHFLNVMGKTYLNISAITRCTSQCPRKCLQTLYVMNVQSLSKLETGNSEAEFYFSDNIFERVVENFAYGIINLLCDMGGNLGLFLGFSLLTLLDIVRSFSRGLKWIIRK